MCECIYRGLSPSFFALALRAEELDSIKQDTMINKEEAISITAFLTRALVLPIQQADYYSYLFG